MTAGISACGGNSDSLLIRFHPKPKSVLLLLVPHRQYEDLESEGDPRSLQVTTKTRKDFIFDKDIVPKQIKKKSYTARKIESIKIRTEWLYRAFPLLFIWKKHKLTNTYGSITISLPSTNFLPKVSASSSERFQTSPQQLSVKTYTIHDSQTSQPYFLF